MACCMVVSPVSRPSFRCCAYYRRRQGKRVQRVSRAPCETCHTGERGAGADRKKAPTVSVAALDRASVLLQCLQRKDSISHIGRDVNGAQIRPRTTISAVSGCRHVSERLSAAAKGAIHTAFPTRRVSRLMHHSGTGEEGAPLYERRADGTPPV